MLWLLLALALNLQTPATVRVGQPFEVRVTGAETGLVQLACAGGQLQGTLTATAVNGTAVFPAVQVLGTPGAIQLVAVCGQSTAVQPVLVEGRAATFADRPVPYVGVELTWDDGETIVDKVVKGSPAERDGLEEGDSILAVDGHKGGLDTIADALRTGTGNVTIQTKRKTVTVAREMRPAPPLEFEHVGFQATLSPFQVRVFVADDAGQPLPGARVDVQLDPSYQKTSVLIFSTETVLSDASGTATPAGVTKEDGVATIWCRLYNAATPFDVRLTATASYDGRTSRPAVSNEFTVYRR